MRKIIYNNNCNSNNLSAYEVIGPYHNKNTSNNLITLLLSYSIRHNFQACLLLILLSFLSSN